MDFESSDTGPSPGVVFGNTENRVAGLGFTFRAADGQCDMHDEAPDSADGDSGLACWMSRRALELAVTISSKQVQKTD